MQALTKYHLIWPGAFADFNELLKNAENMNPNTDRFSLIERNVHGVLCAYKQIYDENKKQT